MSFVFAIVCIIVCSLLPSVGQAESQRWQDSPWHSWQKLHNGAVIQNQKGFRLQLTFLKADVLRVWLEPSGTFSRDSSLAVTEVEPAAPKLSYHDNDQELIVQSDRMQLRLQKSTLELGFWTADGTQQILSDRQTDGLSWRANDGAIAYEHKLQGEEHIFGLGEDNDAFLGRMNRRGSVRDLWTGQEIRSGHVTADIPIPLFLSTGSEGQAYGIFFDNSYRTRWDLAYSKSDRVRFEAEGGELDFYVIYGPSLATIIERYTGLTGRPSMPPLWALGFIQSKCTYWNWDEIDDVVDNLRTRQIPMDVMVIDYDWAEVPMNFKWAERWQGLSPKKIKDYGELGTRFLLSNAGPMLRKDASNYAEAKALGLLASDGQGNTVTGGHYGGDIMDFTAPGMPEWLWPQIRPLYESGIDGWWLDLTEPEGEPEQTVYQAGPRAKVHNTFALLNSKVYYQMQKAHAPEDRVFLLNRTGYAGIQRYGTSIWTGDIYSDYPTLMAHVPEALNTGLSGIPYWTNDTGGFLEGLYKGNLSDHGRLYERWLQFSVFSPVTRAHKVGPSAPYMFGSEVEDGARNYLQLRYRLLPYIYSYAWQAHLTGAPLMRAMAFEFQNEPRVFDLRDQYMFGRELLVAPVLTEASDRRRVYFPKGRWIDRDLGLRYEGPLEACVAAPQERIPVFVKAGAIIPKAPLMDYTGQKPWDPLTWEIYPEGRSEFLLYQDDGETSAFERRKAYTETKLRVDATRQDQVSISLKASNQLFVPKQFRYEIHLQQSPRRVSVNHQAISQWRTPLVDSGENSWHWDPQSRVLRLSAVRGEALEQEIHIELAGDRLALLDPWLSLADCPEIAPPRPSADSVKQIPHFYPPPRVPARIEAENYDKGGPGIAYSDQDPGNAGAVYREDDVDIYPSDDLGGGYHLGKIEEAEWYEYTLVAPKTGFYDLSLRYRAQTKARYSWERSAVRISESLHLPETETWQDSPVSPVYLVAGEQILRLRIEEGGFELNAIQVTSAKKPAERLPAPLCSGFDGGYGQEFSCFDAFRCRKQNSDWGSNSSEANWCLVHEAGVIP